jgi:hypothetical protein
VRPRWELQPASRARENIPVRNGQFLTKIEPPTHAVTGVTSLSSGAVLFRV